mgnify:CR=1 FL=1
MGGPAATLVALSTPPQRVASILVLRRLHLTAAEIAAACSMPLSTVSAVLKREGENRATVWVVDRGNSRMNVIDEEGLIENSRRVGEHFLKRLEPIIDRYPFVGDVRGAGLFIGSGAGIQAAGPAVLISYLVAGTLIILVMWALGEMAAANPNSGAFSVYAEKAMGRTAGATVGWLWWLQLVVVIAAEALGAAGLLATIGRNAAVARIGTARHHRLRPRPSAVDDQHDRLVRKAHVGTPRTLRSRFSSMRASANR